MKDFVGNKVVIIGQGYVGLPLAAAAASEGWKVVGIEKKKRIIELVNNKKSHIEDISDDKIAEMLDSGSYEITNDETRIAEADIVILCVPTPVDDRNQPDMSFIESAIESIVKYVKDETLVISESTAHPGTLRSFVIPKFTNTKKQRQLYFAVAPERVNPRDKNWNLKNTPRVLSGIDEKSGQRALQFYKSFCNNVILVDSPEIAESAKLLENTYRLVNISLINEFAVICTSMNIDIYKIVEAASSKPYGFMPFYPGIGIGGECIPVDPLYFAWWAKQNQLNTPLIQQAITTNNKMPEHFFNLISSKFGLNGKTKKIMLIGIAYKVGVSDIRNSPSLILKSHLEKAGHTVIWHDPIVKEWEKTQSCSLEEDCDLVVIAVNQPGIDLDLIKSKNVPIYDCTNSIVTEQYDND
jgi:UDP-N-acetyl-D-glucosamine dehydrogenase